MIYFGSGSSLNIFLSGMVTVLCWIVALFFARFYFKSRDRLFLCFSFAFFMLGIERVIISVNEIANEQVNLVIFIRLACFLLILAAIVDKNRRNA